MYRSIFEQLYDNQEVFTDGPYNVDWSKVRSLVGKSKSLDDYLANTYKVRGGKHYRLSNKSIYFSNNVDSNTKTNIIHGVTRGIG